jgi:hypothetical protein
LYILVFSAEPKVRKHQRDQLALLLGFRTLEQVRGAGSHRNQSFQCGSERIVASLVLLDAGGNLCLLLFQSARFFVIFVLSNPLLPQVPLVYHSTPADLA